jgi:hypothetical protein
MNDDLKKFRAVIMDSDVKESIEIISSKEPIDEILIMLAQVADEMKSCKSFMDHNGNKIDGAVRNLWRVIRHIKKEFNKE